MQYLSLEMDPSLFSKIMPNFEDSNGIFEKNISSKTGPHLRVLYLLEALFNTKQWCLLDLKA